MSESKPQDPPSKVIRSEEVTYVTPTNQALYEAGKTLLIESVSTGREFCKFMIGTSMSAIPIYFALLKFMLPEKYVPIPNGALLALIPAVLFLIAGIIFVVGFFPQKGIASLDLPDEIEKERSNAVDRRHRLSICGFSVFCLSVVVAILITAYFLQRPKTLPETDTAEKQKNEQPAQPYPGSADGSTKDWPKCHTTATSMSQGV